jgi:hypothetical protein
MPAEPGVRRGRLALRSALLRLAPPLEAIAEDVLGLVSRVDLVARDPEGAVTAVLEARSGGDLERLAEGIAQRAWLAARLADWNQLAPHLGLAVERGVRLLLVAPCFDERTRAAAAALGEGAIQLAERLPRGDLDVDLRPLETDPAAPPDAPRASGRTATGFRTRLRD